MLQLTCAAVDRDHYHFPFVAPPLEVVVRRLIPHPKLQHSTTGDSVGIDIDPHVIKAQVVSMPVNISSGDWRYRGNSSTSTGLGIGGSSTSTAQPEVEWMHHRSF